MAIDVAVTLGVILRGEWVNIGQGAEEGVSIGQKEKLGSVLLGKELSNKNIIHVSILIHIIICKCII